MWRLQNLRHRRRVRRQAHPVYSAPFRERAMVGVSLGPLRQIRYLWRTQLFTQTHLRLFDKFTQ